MNEQQLLQNQALIVSELIEDSVEMLCDEHLLSGEKVWVMIGALAEAKLMLGQARSKFGQITGPQGGTTLNGDAIKTEAQTEMTALEEELKTYTAGNQGLGAVSYTHLRAHETLRYLVCRHEL